MVFFIWCFIFVLDPSTGRRPDLFSDEHRQDELHPLLKDRRQRSTVRCFLTGRISEAALPETTELDDGKQTKPVAD